MMSILLLIIIGLPITILLIEYWFISIPIIIFMLWSNKKSDTNNNFNIKKSEEKEPAGLRSEVDDSSIANNTEIHEERLEHDFYKEKIGQKSVNVNSEIIDITNIKEVSIAVEKIENIKKSEEQESIGLRSEVDDSSIANNTEIHEERLEHSFFKEKIRQKSANANSEIINIINIKEVSIAIKKIKKIKKNNLNCWIDLLQFQLPSYENSNIRNTQVIDEILKLYSNICVFIDSNLEETGESFELMIQENSKYYMSSEKLLNLIYEVAKIHIMDRYHSFYKNNLYDYSYHYLKKILGTKLTNEVYDYAIKYKDQIAFPTQQTIMQFNMTPNGLPYAWWDINGRLRDEKKFSNKELKFLLISPSRDTKLWEISEISSDVLKIYLALLKILDKKSANNEWNSRNLNNLHQYTIRYERNCDYWQDDAYECLQSLLKVSENLIREILPKTSITQVLDIQFELKRIRNFVPSTVYEKIINYLNTSKENFPQAKINCLVSALLSNGYGNWKLQYFHIVNLTSPNKILEELNTYKLRPDYIKLLNYIITNSKNDDLVLIGISELNYLNKITNKNLNIATKLIHPSNVSALHLLFKKKKEMNMDTYNELINLKSALYKEIDLNIKELESARRELSQTIQIVNDYIEEDNFQEKLDKSSLEIESNTKIESNKKENLSFESEIAEGSLQSKYSQQSMELIQEILSEGSVEINVVECKAKKAGKLLNIYINDINKEMYELFSDQLIVIDNQIKIDDFYFNEVKEMFNNGN